MSLDMPKRKSSSIDGQWIRENEAREFKYKVPSQYSSSTSKQSSEDFMADIRRRMAAIDDLPMISSTPDKEVQEDNNVIKEIDEILNNLNQARKKIEEHMKQNEAAIQESGSKSDIQEQKPTNNVGTIPHEPAISPVSSSVDNRISNMSESQERKNDTPMHTEREKEEIREQMKKSQAELAQTLEWAKNQPNVPQTVSLGSSHTEELPEWTKDKGVSGYTEPTIEQVRAGVEVSSGNSQVEQSISNDNEKEILIDGIITGMLNEGEFHNSGLDVVRKADDIRYVKDKLKGKSLDELRLLLSSYKKTDEEQLSSGGMSR